MTRVRCYNFCLFSLTIWIYVTLQNYVYFYLQCICGWSYSAIGKEVDKILGLFSPLNLVAGNMKLLVKFKVAIT